MWDDGVQSSLDCIPLRMLWASSVSKNPLVLEAQFVDVHHVME